MDSKDDCENIEDKTRSKNKRTQTLKAHHMKQSISPQSTNTKTFCNKMVYLTFFGCCVNN